MERRKGFTENFLLSFWKVISSISPPIQRWIQKIKSTPSSPPWNRFEQTRQPSRLMKNAHLLRSPHPLSLRRTSKYASFLRISGALHLGIFDQPLTKEFFS